MADAAKTGVVVVILVIIAVVAVAVSMYGGSRSPYASTTSAPHAPTTTVHHAIVTPPNYTVTNQTTVNYTANAKETVNLTETEFSIAPKVIYASPGEYVILHVYNAGKINHSISVVGPGLNVTLYPQLIAPNSSAYLNFTVPASITGNYTYFCPVPGHKELGMIGTLVVRT